MDLKYRTGFWQGRPMKTNLKELCEGLGSLGVWVRLHYVYPYPHVDDIIPLMAEGRSCPTWICRSSTAAPVSSRP
ncbi:MAG: hypothetical protein R3F38_07035 [Gammaproteobacteria bacterium]